LQTLLRPIVSQFVVEQPESLVLVADAALVEEAGEMFVLLLGVNSSVIGFFKSCSVQAFRAPYFQST
jgi:hypothetical protein